MSLAGTVFGILSVVGAIAVFTWMILRRRFRVGFKTFDEVDVVQQLMVWLAPKLAGRKGPLLAASALALNSHLIPVLQSISREDLAILIPFIDEWIEGKLPPQNLPAEYEDYRPRTLLAFKQPLQSEGLRPPR